ncbi:GNAT family N-acetyltransferase [Roseicyclus sp.]|uniref:GNAT family N-acetyltransferase n=1 Tax=Roseicyclus sp. TaxID=1914329 RepID=UPI003F6B4C93
MDMTQHALPLQQSQLYHDALRRIGADAQRFCTKGGEALVLRRSLGPLGKVALSSCANLRGIDAACGMGADLGAAWLVVNAGRPCEGLALYRAGYIPLAAPRKQAVLSLAGGSADWLGRMHGKWRNRLRRAQRDAMRTIPARMEGRDLTIRVSAMPPDPAHWILRADAAQQRDRGYRGLPPQLIAAMAATPGALHLYTARIGGKVIAAMLFARHGTGASYLIGWSDHQGRKFSAHNLLMWRAMGDLAAMGVSAIDLGLCDTAANAGLARFKLGAGATLEVSGGTWLYARPLAPLHGLLRRLRATPPPHATTVHGPAARRGFQAP